MYRDSTMTMIALLASGRDGESVNVNVPQGGVARGKVG